MSLTRCTARASADAPLPAVVVSVLQDSVDIFMRFQESRYVEEGINLTEEEAAREVTAEVMRTKPTPAARAPHRTPGRVPVAEAYRQCIATLGDHSVNALWGLCNEVLQIHDGNMADYINASTMVRRWYATYFADMAYIDEKIDEARHVDVPSCSEDALYDLGKFLLDTVERTFYAGAFAKMAEAMSALVGLLHRAPQKPLPAHVDSALSDVLRLMATSYDTTEGSHKAWQDDAKGQIYEAKRIFTEYTAPPAPSACETIAQEYCRLCLDVLLITHGDAKLIRERCTRAHFSLFDYLTGVCAITNPTLLLGQLQPIVADAMDAFTSADAPGAWTYRVAEALLAANSVEALVAAMQSVGEVAETLGWSVDDLAAASVAGARGHAARDDDEDENEAEAEDDEDDAPLTEEELMPRLMAGTSNAPLRHLALMSMAAHMADVCAPPIVAPCAAVDLTLARNELVMRYLELFAAFPQTWRIAALYAVYSPLMNPVVLYNVSTYAARLAANDNQVYARLCHLFHHFWAASSPHQVILRAKAKTTMPASATLLAWLEALEFLREKAYKDVHRYIIGNRFQRGDYAGAVWLAVESQTAQGIQWRVKALLLAEDALSHPGVFAIGEGVHNSFIALDSCPTVALATSLRVCASIAAYTRAASASAAMQQAPASDVHHAPLALRTMTWTLQTIVEALESMDSCDFFVHPSTTFTLVEHAADLVLQLRRWSRLLQPHTPVSVSAALSSTVLPILHQSFELTQVHHRQMDLKSSAIRIREKLARTCDSHLDV